MIICSVLSIVCGIVATFMFFYGIYGHCTSWADTMPGEPCPIDESRFELWWVIPLASFVGFIAPGIAYVIGKISDIFY